MRCRLEKTRHREFRTLGMFIEVSLTDGDTRTLLDTFRAQALDPYGLRSRGQVVNHTLSGAVGLGLRDDYEANQERIPLWQLYYLLVHLNLFGRGYLASVENILRKFS